MNLPSGVASWLLGIVILSFVGFGIQGLVTGLLGSRVGDGLRFSLTQNAHRFDLTQKSKAARRLPNVPIIDTLLMSLAVRSRGGYRLQPENQLKLCRLLRSSRLGPLSRCF